MAKPQPPSQPQPASPGPSAARRRRFGGCLGRFFCLAVLLVGVCAIAWFSWRIITHNRLQAKLAGYRAAGVACSADDLPSIYPPIPDHENNVALYSAACQQLASQEAAEQLARFAPIIHAQQMPDPDQPWTEWEEARSAVQAYQGALDMLHAAAQDGGRAWMPLDLQHEPGLDAQSIHMLRQGFQFLDLEACVRAKAEGAAGLSEPIIAMLKYSNATADLPTDQQLGIAWDRHALERLVDAFRYSDFSVAELTEMQTQLETIDLLARLRKWMDGQRIVGHQLFVDAENFRGAEGQSVLVDLRDMVARWSPFVHEDHLYYLEHCDQLQRALENDWAKVEREVNRLEQGHLDKMRGSMNAVRFAVSSKLATPIDGFVRSAADMEMWRRLLITALAIKRYEAERGQLPAHLSELVPGYVASLPLDMHNAQPFHYLRERETFTVYSIGANNKDEYARGGDDVVLRLRKRQAEGNQRGREKVD